MKHVKELYANVVTPAIGVVLIYVSWCWYRQEVRRYVTLVPACSSRPSGLKVDPPTPVTALCPLSVFCVNIQRATTQSCTPPTEFNATLITAAKRSARGLQAT
jgi:hypothetical protein